MAEYYVFNPRDAHLGWMDKCIVWWREGGHGYTYDLRDAGVFTDAHKEAGYPPRECVYVPKEIVDRVAYRPVLCYWDDGWRGNLRQVLEDAGADLPKHFDAVGHAWSGE